MKNTVKSCLVIAAITVTGCNTVTGYRPVVDTYGDNNAYRLNQDMAQCEQLAKEASSLGKQTALGAGVGGLIGAGGGAAVGAVMGKPGIGAAIGAIAGGVGGASKQGIQADNEFKTAYNSCLRQRGHRVIN